MTLTLAPASTSPAVSLIDQINHEHHQAETATSQLLGHAIQCGYLLHEAKLTLEHGQWAPWLAENFAGSDRTAQKYMQIADAHRQNPELLTVVDAGSINAAVTAVSKPKPKLAPAGRDPIIDADIVEEERFNLTARQLQDLIHRFGGQADESAITQWLRRLTEPKVTLCTHCTEPVIQVTLKGTTVTADRYEWLPRGVCTKCLQTRNAHPGQPVSCPHCNSTGYTGTAERPAGPMLAMDMAWGDEPRIRIIGERTDRRKGESLHPLHRCAVESEQAA